LIKSTANPQISLRELFKNIIIFYFPGQVLWLKSVLRMLRSGGSQFKASSGRKLVRPHTSQQIRQVWR
jgi:hypothetical protein